MKTAPLFPTATPSFMGKIPWSLPDSDTKKADPQKESAFFIYLISVPEPIRKRSNPIFHTDVSAPPWMPVAYNPEKAHPLPYGRGCAFSGLYATGIQGGAETSV